MHSFFSLATEFEARFSSTLPFPDQPATLYEPCRYFLGIGGKRVRPVLCLMAAELFGDITEDAWRAAGAIELFHNFTLAHDDIMDKAPLRRGQPTLHTKYNLTAGILCGDALCIKAYEELTAIDNALKPILSLFNRTAIEVCEGQQLDMDFETQTIVSIDEYIRMITLKTSVLLACSLKIGALTAGALGDNARKLYDFGLNLGIAFQLQDDYLDAFGVEEKLGKQSGGDIIANKKTYLLLKALENAGKEDRAVIDSLLETDPADKVEHMKALFVKTGADVLCRQASEHYSQLAFGYLDELAVPSLRKEHLRELAAYLLNRDF